MASTHTLTGNVHDLAGVPLSGTDIRVSVVTNLGDGEALVDKTTNRVHLGGKPASVDGTGMFTIDLIDTNATDLNVVGGTLEYQVQAEYVDKATRQRPLWTSGWFPLTADANLADITTDVSPMAVQSASAFAQASADSAAAAEASYQAAADLVITDLGTTDGQTKALIQNPGSQTATALSATIATGIQTEGTNYLGTFVPVTRLGVSATSPNTDQSAAIQAAINTGLPLYFPPGRYVAAGLIPKSGMHLLGAGKGDPDNPTSPRTIIRTINGDLFAAGSFMCVIENMELQGASTPNTPGDLVTGDWSQGVFRSVRFLQYRGDKSCVNVFGWIDMSIEGASEMLAPNGTISGACFKAVDSNARIAQFAFRDTRVRGGNSQPAIHLEARNGGISLVSSVTFDNVNFEVCNGGCIKLLSVRGAHIRGCGAWDLTASSGNPMIDIGEGSNGGAASGQITIDGWLRDNTTAPAGGDIRATSSTFGLNIHNPAHHIGTMNVNAGGASGRIYGAKATLFNAENMTTDTFQNYTPTIASATTLGNGTLSGRFKRNGRDVRALVTLTIGSTTTVGNLRFSLPVVPIDGTVNATVVDADLGAVYQFGGYISTDGLARVHPLGTNGSLVTVTPTVPFTWAAGDTVTVDVRYRAST